MPIIALTQIAGGVGTTTLAANLVNIWPNDNRILVELGITGGSLAWTMGLDVLVPPSPENLCREGFDLGTDVHPVPSLSEIAQDKWELPVLPAPVIPDFPRPGEPMWWQKRVDLITQSHMDVIVDLGRLAPEHLGIHNKVLNTATVIVVVTRNVAEAKAAVRRLSMYQDRLAIVMISRLRSLPEDITDEVGCTCLDVLAFDDDIAASVWRNTLVTSTKAKPVKNYLATLTNLAIKLGGK